MKVCVASSPVFFLLFAASQLAPSAAYDFCPGDYHAARRGPPFHHHHDVVFSPRAWRFSPHGMPLFKPDRPYFPEQFSSRGPIVDVDAGTTALFAEQLPGPADLHTVAHPELQVRTEQTITASDPPVVAGADDAHATGSTKAEPALMLLIIPPLNETVTAIADPVRTTPEPEPNASRNEAGPHLRATDKSMTSAAEPTSVVVAGAVVLMSSLFASVLNARVF